MNSNEELLKISNISIEAGNIILDFYNKKLNKLVNFVSVLFYIM